MSDLAAPLDGLRISLSEVEVLTVLTTAAYDDGDWGDADPAVVDRIGTLLGLIEKSAIAAMAAFQAGKRFPPGRSPMMLHLLSRSPLCLPASIRPRASRPCR